MHDITMASYLPILPKLPISSEMQAKFEVFAKKS